MTDFLTRLAERTLGLMPPVQAVLTPTYGSALARATDFELDSSLSGISSEFASERAAEAQTTGREEPDNPGNERLRSHPLTVQSDLAIANSAEFDSAILSSPQPAQPNAVSMSRAVPELAGARAVEAQPTPSEESDNPGNERLRSHPLTVQSDLAIANSPEFNAAMLSSPQPAQPNNAEANPPRSHSITSSQVLSPMPSAQKAARLDSTFLAADVLFEPVSAETMAWPVRAADPLPLGSLVSESQIFSDSSAAEVILERQESHNQTLDKKALLYSNNNAKLSDANQNTPTAKKNSLSAQLPAIEMRSQVRVGTSQQHELASQANQVDSLEEKNSSPGSLPDTAERSAIRVSLFADSANAGLEKLSFEQSKLEVAFVQAASSESAARSEMPAGEPPSQRQRIDSLLALESVSGLERFSTGERSRSPQPEAVPTSTPTIQVSIGRIEVRSTQPPAPSRQFARPEPRLSLSAYLKQRQGGKP